MAQRWNLIPMNIRADQIYKTLCRAASLLYSIIRTFLLNSSMNRKVIV